jgi:stress response protein YsnF
MATTVISTIDDANNAQRLINELVKAGIEGRDVEILEGSEAKLTATIVERGFDEDDARGYAKAARRGKTLVAALAPERRVDEVVAIMERYEAGGSGKGPDRQEETVQEVEEELTVGKRKSASGGVRVVSSVSETPVEKTVTLREEEIEVERKPVDRKLSPKEAEAAFEEKTVELLATSEEAEISKEARVVEEVSLNKRVEEREETVRDKVRRTEVEVEEVGAKAGKSR